MTHCTVIQQSSLHISAERALTPVPRVSILIRVAVAADFAFIDSLQKVHRNQVGFMLRPQLEQYLAGGHVLIAEDGSSQPIGYVIARDRYFKRDDVGVIFQLNVAPGSQRSLVGAALVRAVFERAANGCKLFCCWCAQDIEANHFWESMHFTPLAFRAGSRGKKRIHIFWQRRIRTGDHETPFWYPSHTNAGAIRQDRIVFPIPPGTHWSDAKPVILPDASPVECEQAGALPEGSASAAAERRAKSRTKQPAAARLNEFGRVDQLASRCLRFGPLPAAEPAPTAVKIEKKPKARAAKADPRHVAMARDLRDRYLEEVNSGRIVIPVSGKYDVSRRLEAAAEDSTAVALLKAV